LPDLLGFSYILLDPEQRQAVENLLDAMTEGLANTAICRAIREDVTRPCSPRPGHPGAATERTRRCLTASASHGEALLPADLHDPAQTSDDEGMLEYSVGWSFQHG
jgi:hypothetical protein